MRSVRVRFPGSQGFELGLDETSGSLRAKRGPKGQGRVYTLEYTGLDVADNATTCTTTVTVPPNMGRGQWVFGFVFPGDSLWTVFRSFLASLPR